MHRRIFFRYFVACALMILLTVMALAAATTGVLTVRNVQEQDRNMEKAATKVASMLQGMPANYNFFIGTVMGGAMDTVKETLGCDMLIVNQWGRVVQTTLGDGMVLDGARSAEALDTVFRGEVYRRQGVFVTDLGNAYTVGMPIRGEDGGVVGCVFVTARQVRVGSAMRRLTATFFVCGLIVLAVALLCIYFITKRITRPLNEMALATKQYARGDFTKRITVLPDDEVGDLARTFNRMADSLDRLETMRRGFIADVSHELRTPMTTIGGFIDGMLDGTIPPDQQEKYLLLVSDEVRRLSRLVNNLLDVARIQSGEVAYRMAPFDLCEAAGRVLLTVEDRIQEAGIHLNVLLPEEPLDVLGDRDAIHRVIYNLVDNALKFTPPEGEITLTAERLEKGKVRFSVRNTGQGIPREEAARIFERFYKTDKSRGRNKKGVGLGLYMVKTIVEAHGEEIFVTSEEGAFAEFSFTLKEAEDAVLGGF